MKNIVFAKLADRGGRFKVMHLLLSPNNKIKYCDGGKGHVNKASLELLHYAKFYLIFLLVPRQENEENTLKKNDHVRREIFPLYSMLINFMR